MKKQMMKKIALVLLSAFLMVGCGDYEDYEDYEDYDAAEDSWDDDSWDDESSDDESSYDVFPTNPRPQGSVNLLEGKTILVTIFVNTPDSEPMTDEQISRCMTNQQIAVNYLMDQAKACGKESEILMWDEEHQDLVGDFNVTVSLEDVISGVDQYYIEKHEKMIEFPIATLVEKYGTDSIGFVLLINGKGVSYAGPYMEEFGTFYYEDANVYLYDGYADGMVYESPATYAHELLHIFGARDLYQIYDENEGITQEVVDYVQANEPTCLMNATTNPDGSHNYEAITHPLSDITKAEIGLIDDDAVVAMFPSLAVENPGAY